MRLAVLDVGANTVNMLVFDSRSAVPLPARAWKARTCLSELLEPDGSIGKAGRRRLTGAVRQATEQLSWAEADTLFPYATAVVRDAPNRDEVRAEVAAATGIRLGLLTGVEEAHLTFLAGDPPSPRAVTRLRRHVRRQIDRVAAEASWSAPRTAVAISRCFQQLARLSGAAPLRRGPFVTRELHRRALRPWIDRLAAMPVRQRARLPGVSPHRARQILAGAIVAHELMRGLDLPTLQICPWALREGILLRRLETDQPRLGNAGWVSWAPPAAVTAHPGAASG